MSGANSLRGEVDLPLISGGQKLRPTFASLVAAEAELGSLFGVLERAVSADVRLGEMGALFWHCLAEPFDRASFEAELLDTGAAQLLPVYRSLLAAIFQPA